MVRWSKAPRCWDEFKCNIWVNSWFRPPTEYLGERDFFPSKKKGMFCEKMMVKATFVLERRSFFIFGGWSYLYGFFLSPGKKSNIYIMTFLRQPTLNPTPATVGPRHRKVLRRVVILPPFLLQPPAALLPWFVSLEIARRMRDRCWPRDFSQVRHG